MINTHSYQVLSHLDQYGALKLTFKSELMQSRIQYTEFCNKCSFSLQFFWIFVPTMAI